MGIGLTENLAFAAICVWLASVLISTKFLGLPWALFASTIKIGLSLVYFSYFFTSEMLMKDDQVYHELSVYLFDRGWGPIRMLVEPQGFTEVGVFVGSGHNFYYWWNLLAFSLFGKYYYSAVFLNVGLTFVAALLFYRFLLEAKLPHLYSKFCSLFFLLHWDIITWSSFINLKDMIVLTLTIGSIFFLAQLFNRFSLLRVALLIACFGLFTLIRYYVPALITVAAVFWYILEKRDWRALLLVPLAAITAIVLAPSAMRDLSYFKVGLPFYPAIRFFLMPQFWTLQPDEQFLFISSLLHWVFFLPLLVGAYNLWKSSAVCRLALVYALVIICFYSLVPELQGYRHRMQISFIIIWCQFNALWMLLRRLNDNWSTSSIRTQ